MKKHNPNLSESIDDPFYKTVAELISDMEEELDESAINMVDEYTTLLSAITDLEEFLINTYSSHLALTQLLKNKGIITIEEFVKMKDAMRVSEQIKPLYDGVKEKRKIIEEREIK